MEGTEMTILLSEEEISKIYVMGCESMKARVLIAQDTARAQLKKVVEWLEEEGYWGLFDPDERQALKKEAGL
jgi:hypothetical protein